jgi:excisionase family DNA binding protein
MSEPRKPRAVLPRRFLQPSEIAPYFGRCSEWVRARVRDGTIRSVRVGPSRLIPLEEVDRFNAMADELTKKSA